MTCPLCNNPTPKIIGLPITDKKATAFLRNQYKVVKCSSCKFYFVAPRIDLSVEEWSQLYDNNYFQNLNSWYEKQRLSEIQTRFDKLLNMSKSQSINFLDIGCGEGLALITAKKLGWNVYGIDISDNRVEGAKHEKINFTVGDLYSQNYPTNYFDFVYMDSVMEHLVDPVNQLKEINRIMKKGAIICIGVPNEDSLFDNFRQIVFKFIGKQKLSAKLRPFSTPFHVSGFTKKSIGIIAKLTNFEVVEIKNFATHFEYKKYSKFSREFLIHLSVLPLEILAVFLRMERYFEIYLKK